MGKECEIVSFTLQYPGFLFPGTTQLAEGDQIPEGITVTPLINSIEPFSWFKAAKYISKKQPSLVIIRYWLPFMAPCLGTIARSIKKKIPGVRILAIADNVIPHENRPGDKTLTNYFVKAIDSFVVMSRSVMEDLKLFDNKKPVIMQPHPVYDIFGEVSDKSTSRTTLGLPDGNLVLFFGFIRYYKGLDLLLQAMADEKVRAQNIRLVVAGEFYDDKKPYLDLIQKLQLNDRVILHDHYIAKNMVRHYFSAADLVVQPYRDATQSGVTQIAYHFGKPMVVTNVGGLPEIVPDGKAGMLPKSMRILLLQLWLIFLRITVHPNWKQE
jgi:glycosyltransferase involved in cell wall biosynthesis